MDTMRERSSYRQGKNHKASSIVRIPNFSSNSARLGPTPLANRMSVSCNKRFDGSRGFFARCESPWLAVTLRSGLGSEPGRESEGCRSAMVDKRPRTRLAISNRSEVLADPSCS